MSQKSEKYARELTRRMDALEGRFSEAVAAVQSEASRSEALPRRRMADRARAAEHDASLWRAIALAAVVVLVLVTLLAALSVPARGEDEPPALGQAVQEVQAVQTIQPPPAEVPEDYENEKIENALFASGYFRSDVPLDGDTQALLRAACGESGVPYELALAVVWQETRFQNILGDDGESCGYMQVQERWHKARIARLGVTDLNDPAGNFRVGCDYLAELLDKYPLEDALTAYNSGSPGKSEYAASVMAYLDELAEE